MVKLATHDWETFSLNSSSSTRVSTSQVTLFPSVLVLYCPRINAWPQVRLLAALGAIGTGRLSTSKNHSRETTLQGD